MDSQRWQPYQLRQAQTAPQRHNRSHQVSQDRDEKPPAHNAFTSTLAPSAHPVGLSQRDMVGTRYQPIQQGQHEIMLYIQSKRDAIVPQQQMQQAPGSYRNPQLQVPIQQGHSRPYRHLGPASTVPTPRRQSAQCRGSGPISTQQTPQAQVLMNYRGVPSGSMPLPTPQQPSGSYGNFQSITKPPSSQLQHQPWNNRSFAASAVRGQEHIDPQMPSGKRLLYAYAPHAQATWASSDAYQTHNIRQVDQASETFFKERQTSTVGYDVPGTKEPSQPISSIADPGRGQSSSLDSCHQPSENTDKNYSEFKPWPTDLGHELDGPPFEDDCTKGERILDEELATTSDSATVSAIP